MVNSRYLLSDTIISIQLVCVKQLSIIVANMGGSKARTSWSKVKKRIKEQGPHLFLKRRIKYVIVTKCRDNF